MLDLTGHACRPTERIGPYVRENDNLVPVRDWFCDQIVMISGQELKRPAVTTQVRSELTSRSVLPTDLDAARQVVNEVVQDLTRKCGRSNKSQPVSDLVKAELVRRHYQGYAVDHLNRGAQRQAVYQVTGLAAQVFSIELSIWACMQ